ncbi:p53 and DNA damage-regulated protein 1 [Condylostylus longicornis]|uniref:p53 and DNA damage-regulated protein 1 n=1 Tax=Condylostylus longicornis TaxID=2530218 RepID=UPI00244DB29C|nr:p53 and DNA damage-regulated protein 1 [Condylostylus longicornis]
MSKTNNEKIIEILIETEKVADKIMVIKQEIISLDKRRQENREAIREIGKSENDKKVWITVGSLLIKMEKLKALELLKKDQNEIEIEINKLRSEQKILVNQHRDLEHSSPFSGSNLKPLSAKEISALKTNLPLLS